MEQYIKTFTEFEFYLEIQKNINSNSEDFTEINDQPNIEYEGMLLPVDFMGKYKGEKFVLLCKTDFPKISERIDEYITRLEPFKNHGKLIIAVNSVINNTYKNSFSINNIEIWDKSDLMKIFKLAVPVKMNFKKQDPNAKLTISKEQQLIEKLKSLNPGKPDAYKYQALVEDILEYLFSPDLQKFKGKKVNETGTNIRDIILRNYCENGFWNLMRTEYGAFYVIADAKNYSDPFGKDCVLQISNYLKRHGSGKFGILCSRFGADNGSEQTIREHWIAYSKLILTVNDSDLVQMLELKENNEDPTEVLREKIDFFRLGF